MGEAAILTGELMKRAAVFQCVLQFKEGGSLCLYSTPKRRNTALFMILNILIEHLIGFKISSPKTRKRSYVSCAGLHSVIS